MPVSRLELIEKFKSVLDNVDNGSASEDEKALAVFLFSVNPITGKFYKPSHVAPLATKVFGHCYDGSGNDARYFARALKEIREEFGPSNETLEHPGPNDVLANRPPHPPRVNRPPLPPASRVPPPPPPPQLDSGSVMEAPEPAGSNNDSQNQILEYLKGIDNKVDGLKDDLVSLNNKVEANRGDIVKVDNKVDDLANDVGEVKSELGGVKNTAEAAQSTAEAALNLAQKSVEQKDEIQSDVEIMKVQLAALQQQLNMQKEKESMTKWRGWNTPRK